MAEFGERLQADIDRFRDRVFTDPLEVLDPEGMHHEFVSGNHGRKLDFDKIIEGSDFYIEWVSIYARAVRSMYADRLPDALVGIANGANRLATSIAPLLGSGVLGLTTEKLDAKTVRLDEEARLAIKNIDIRFAVTIEDVGTTGSTTATAINDLRSAGVSRIESVNGWQRNDTLPRLDELKVPYHAVILNPLPMYSPLECEKSGYHAQGWKFIEHAK